MVEAAVRARQDERAWWLRVPLVLIDPRHVFAALRDDSDAAAEARQEPVALLVLLAGIAGVLATDVAARALDEPEWDALVLVVWSVVAGALHGVVGYFGVGALVYLGASFAGGLGSYRRARHVLAFAAAPLVLSILLLPVRAALYGGDAFRRGGTDGATGADAFGALTAAGFLWSVVLLAIGLRAVHGWTWPRAVAATVLPGAPVVLALARAYGLV